MLSSISVVMPLSLHDFLFLHVAPFLFFFFMTFVSNPKLFLARNDESTPGGVLCFAIKGGEGLLHYSLISLLKPSTSNSPFLWYGDFSRLTGPEGPDLSSSLRLVFPP